MLILHDTDGTPLSLHSYRRGLWLRHEGRQGRNLRFSRMGRSWKLNLSITAPFLVGMIVGQVVQWFSVPLGAASVLAGGLLTLFLGWRDDGRRPARLPVHRGPVPDPQDRLGRSARIHSLLALAMGAFVVVTALDALASSPRWTDFIFPGCLSLAALPVLASSVALAAGLRRLRALNRRAIALSRSGSEATEC